MVWCLVQDLRWFWWSSKEFSLCCRRSRVPLLPGWLIPSLVISIVIILILSSIISQNASTNWVGSIFCSILLLLYHRCQHCHRHHRCHTSNIVSSTSSVASSFPPSSLAASILLPRHRCQDNEVYKLAQGELRRAWSGTVSVGGLYAPLHSSPSSYFTFDHLSCMSPFQILASFQNSNSYAVARRLYVRMVTTLMPSIILKNSVEY